MTYEDWVPLTMGPKIVGKVRIDLETGEMEGKMDPQFADLLNTHLPHGMTDISFTGKAGIYPELARQELKDYLEGDATNGN